MEDDRSVTRACGVLTGIIGILGIVMPFTKQHIRESLQISMMGLGISLSMLSIISKATEQKVVSQQSLKFNNNESNGQKNY